MRDTVAHCPCAENGNCSNRIGRGHGRVHDSKPLQTAATFRV